MGFRLRPLIFCGKLLVNERIVEYPQILQWIKQKGNILDIGCVSSRLPLQLASLGYKIYGVDIRTYPFQHPNFRFHKADVFEWVPERSFDVILLISTLEHFGFGGYGDLVLVDADKKAIERITPWLSKDGQLLVSVPFGKAEITRKHRIYDSERLKYLFSDFKWVNQKYFQRINNSWIPSSAEELKETASPGLPPNGVAILNLQHGSFA
jgi:SAM-dependent methyltransferase